jgi:5-methylcytosine-specific restriction endonuclease McrA
MRKIAPHRNLKLTLTTPGIPGWCRFCKQQIKDATGAILTRKTWHPACVKTYQEQQDGGFRRKAIFLRDGGLCRSCGATENHLYGNWQADHIIPLAAGGSFELTNVQTLCCSCHFSKSKTDLKTIKSYRENQGNTK